jgi:hypothetical protein
MSATFVYTHWIKKTFFLSFFVLLIVSCNNNRKQDIPKQETPKALDDKSSSYELLSKRSYEDLVESLYNEVVAKDTDLKKIEETIDELAVSKSDSTYLFDQFNNKNQSYFNAAEKHISGIKDSLLRNKMKTLLANNLIKYTSSIKKHKDLLSAMEAKNLTIADLHSVLKIVKTLPLMEKYQSDHLPATKPLENYIQLQDATIKFSDSLLRIQ